MNAKSINHQYQYLRAEERFQLILAASGRGDVQERERLARGGQSKTWTMSDHIPYAMAFMEIADLTYIELLAESADYLEHFLVGYDLSDSLDKDVKPDSESDEGEDRNRVLDLALAAGFTLRAKIEGWELFCQRMNVPAYILWEGFPGYIRLQRARALCQKASFVEEGFKSWLNRIRPPGAEQITNVLITPETFAQDNEKHYRERSRWWNATS